MIYSIQKLLGKFFKFALSLCLCFCISFLSLSHEAIAGKTSMTGDYTKDTINVAKSLKDNVIDEIADTEDSLSGEETVFLITDYISRYRNRSQINKSLSFTTMQTALNALAGHYKTFPNRPVPEKLKNRLNDELSKAEDLVLKQS